MSIGFGRGLNSFLNSFYCSCSLSLFMAASLAALASNSLMYLSYSILLSSSSLSNRSIHASSRWSISILNAISSLSRLDLSSLSSYSLLSHSCYSCSLSHISQSAISLSFSSYSFNFLSRSFVISREGDLGVFTFLLFHLSILLSILERRWSCLDSSSLREALRPSILPCIASSVVICLGWGLWLPRLLLSVLFFRLRRFLWLGWGSQCHLDLLGKP